MTQLSDVSSVNDSNGIVFKLLKFSKEREEFKVSKVTLVSVFIQEKTERIFEKGCGREEIPPTLYLHNMFLTTKIIPRLCLINIYCQ